VFSGAEDRFTRAIGPPAGQGRSGQPARLAGRARLNAGRLADAASDASDPEGFVFNANYSAGRPDGEHRMGAVLPAQNTTVESYYQG